MAADSLTTTWRTDRLELIERYRMELQVRHNDRRAVSTTTQLTRRFAASKGDGQSVSAHPPWRGFALMTYGVGRT